MTKKKRWFTMRARDGSRLAARVPVTPRQPVRLWTWAVVSHNGVHPYLHISPQPTRAQADMLARDMNVGSGRRTHLVRRVIYELRLPSERESVPGLPICRRASALGRL